MPLGGLGGRRIFLPQAVEVVLDPHAVDDAAPDDVSVHKQLAHVPVFEPVARIEVALAPALPALERAIGVDEALQRTIGRSRAGSSGLRTMYWCGVSGIVLATRNDN
jgi:hypothetical protein